MASTQPTAPEPSGDGPKKKKRKGAKAFQRSPLRGYNPAPAWYGWGSAQLDGSPVFLWPDVPRMLRDPQIRFVERMWRAPFQKVKWGVTASNKAVAQFVGAMLRRFWVRSLPKLLSRYFRYGFAPGAAEFAPIRGRVRLVKVRAVEPLDAQARVWNDDHERAGELAGFDVAPHGALAPNQFKGNLTICSPHLFWFAGHGDLTQFHDAPPLAGCFEPWLEKRGRGGAIQSRKLWFKKAAWRGGILYYPEGVSNIGTAENPQYVDNQDLARQALDTIEAGGTMAISSDVNPATNQRKWEYIPPEAYSDVGGLREYPQDLDREILVGAGIPPEVLEASEVGSGWSGRMVPLMGYLGTVDELAGLLLEACDAWLGPLVALNFGENAWYEVKPQSLVDELQQQQQQGAMPGGGQPGLNPSSLFDGKPPAGGDPGGGGGDGPQQPGGGGAGGPLSLSVTIPEDLIRKAERAAGGHKYACAYVDVPRDIAAQLKTLAYSIPNADLYDPANGKGRELEPHVTVRFGLLTDEAADLAPIAADAPPARVTFTGIGHFDGAADGKPYDVVFAAVDSADLRRLNRELAALPHHDTHPEYVPHATIAYVRAGTGAQWARRLTLMAANLTGRDFTAPALVLSARDGSKEEVPFGANAEPRELSWGARGPLELGWTPYKGPKGGTGWVSDTGEVRYQESKPADHEANPETGVESIFAHPDFAHIPSDGSDVGTVRAEFHDKATADGLDAAELHRRAAQHVDRYARLALRDTPELMPADKAVAHLTERHKYWADRAAQAKAEADERRTQAETYEKGAEQNPTYAEGWSAAARSFRTGQTAAEKRQAEAEPIAAQYAAQLERAKGGHVVQAFARARLARTAYENAHAELDGERASKEFARDFADRYFEEDDPKKRARAFVDAFTGDDSLDPTQLPEDTRAAVAEDLAHLPANKLAEIVAEVSTNWGWMDSASAPNEALAPFRAALELAAAGKRAKPVPFDASKPGDYVLYHADDVDTDLMDGARALARTIAPAAGVKFAGDDMLVVKKGSALHKALEEHTTDGVDLDDESALQKLFAGAKSEPMLAVGDVPASARDYGGTSGSKGTGEFNPEEGWNPNAVATYRRISDDVFVRQRAAGDADSESFELVHRKDVPDLTRLPAPYWEGLRDDGDTDADLEETAQRRAEKTSDTGATQKREIGEYRDSIRTHQKEIRAHRDAWNRALAGVPEEDRPEEPDWEGPDASALTDQHDTREDHENALSELNDALWNHSDTLRDEVEAAKEHAANHATNRRASAEAKEEWDAIAEEIGDENMPQEPDWADDLAGDTGRHAKWLDEQLNKAREARDGHAKEGAARAAANAEFERIRAEYQQLGAPEEDWPEVPDWGSPYYDPETEVAEARENLQKYREEQGKHAEARAKHVAAWNDAHAKIGEQLARYREARAQHAEPDLKLNDELAKATETWRDNIPDTAEDEDAEAALQAVHEALDDIDNGDYLDHADEPIEVGEYEDPEEDRLPDDADGTPEELADLAEAAAENRKFSSDALKNDLGTHLADLPEASRKWRASVRADLDAARERVREALELPEDVLTAEDGRAALEALAKQLDAFGKRLAGEGPRELSATVGPDGGDPSTMVAGQANRLMRQKKAQLARALAVAMVRVQLGAAESGDPASAGPKLAQLSALAGGGSQQQQPAQQPQQAAPGDMGEGATLGPLELSWEPYIGKRGARAGQQVGWIDTETKQVRYQKSKPGEHAEKRQTRQASEERGREILRAVARKEATSEDLRELVTHLPVMSVKALRNAKIMLDAKFGNSRRHAQMVETLLASVGGIPGADGAKIDGTKAEPELLPWQQKPAKAEARPPEKPAAGAEDGARPAAESTGVAAPSRASATSPALPNAAGATGGASWMPGAQTARKPAEVQPAAPAQPSAAPDYSKFDALLRTSTDRAQAEQIARATGVPIRPEAAAALPAKGNYANWLRGTDPAALKAAAGSPAVDRAELLDAVKQVYGDAVHAEAKKKSKQGIADLLAGKLPLPKPDDDAGDPPSGSGPGGGSPPPAPPAPPKAPGARDPNAPKIEYVRASAGGQVSEVDGKFYRGGQLMPVHGKYAGQEKPPKGDGVGAASGPASPDSEGGEGGGRAAPRLSPQEAAERRAQLDAEDKARTFQNGPLGALTAINRRTGMPYTGTRGGVGFRQWQEFAQQVGEARLKRIADALPPPSDPAAREDYDFYLNHPQDFKATQTKKHARELPSSANARFAVQHALENAKTLEDVQRIHDLLTGTSAAPQPSRASATSPAIPNAATGTGSASWMPGASTNQTSAGGGGSEPPKVPPVASGAGLSKSAQALADDFKAKAAAVLKNPYAVTDAEADELVDRLSKLPTSAQRAVALAVTGKRLARGANAIRQLRGLLVGVRQKLDGQNS